MTISVLPDPTTPFGRRVADRLRDERVIWLTTVAADGTPQPNPVWFIPESDDEILIYNRHNANRLTHVRQRPRVTLHFDGDGQGGDIVVLNGDAELLSDRPPPHQHPAYLAKYQQAMIRVSGSPEAFGATYPTAIRVRLTRVRGF